MWHSLTVSCSDLLIGGNVSIDIYADTFIRDDLLGISAILNDLIVHTMEAGLYI